MVQTAMKQRARSSVPPPFFRKEGQARFRFFYAYWTTFVVIGSYLTFSLRVRLLGPEYRERALGDVHRRNATRVLTTILKLQGLFIKVGQGLSIMANFLPEAFRSGLEGLQDQVPPRPFRDIERTLRAELGKDVDDVFLSFERTPIASASLGQVHEARLQDGTRVAVKVQHHDIDRMVRTDLLTIRRIMSLVQWFVPVQGLDAYYHQIRELLQRELDFELEANHIERIAKNFDGDPRVLFPTPIRALSTKKVLTGTFVEGAKIVDLANFETHAIDRKDVARRLVVTYCQMIFKDGIYHADPHPGNILVNAAGDLVLLDFGAVAELSREMREGIPEFLEGVIRRDTDRLMKALRKMGFISRSSDAAMTEKIIDYFHQRFQEEVRIESFNLKDIKIDPQRGFENLLDLRRMNVGLKELSTVFHVPRDWVLLERTILLVYGTCAILDPELNPMGIIQPYLQEFVLGTRDFTQIAVETVREMAMEAITLPEDLKKYLTRAVRGELEMRVPEVREGARTVYTVGRQLIYTALSIAGGFAALSLHRHGEDRLALYPLGLSSLALVLLLLSSLFARPRG